MDGVPADRAGPARTMDARAGVSLQRCVPSYRGADVDLAPPLAMRAAADAGRAALIGRESASLYRAAAILAVLALATALRVHGLVRQSAWADEITTPFITDPSRPFGRFWDLLLAHTNPPLSYLLMRCSSPPFGPPALPPPAPTLALPSP